MAFDLDTLRTLDFSDIGSWPVSFRVLAVALVCALLLFGFWHFDINKLRIELANAEAKEVEKKREFEDKQSQAANLPLLEEQLAQIEESFGDLLRQLPNEAEIDSLLIDISQTGLSAGLEFDLFKPKPEYAEEFYAELPIEIQVQGDYHQFGAFISGVSSLPRIVTTHDIQISRMEGNLLVMGTLAKTYRTIAIEGELEEEAAQ